jgi:hypothetical protein
MLRSYAVATAYDHFYAEPAVSIRPYVVLVKRHHGLEDERQRPGDVDGAAYG